MWNQKQFEEVYARYQSSGLRVKDFCRNERIVTSKFFYWQRKLRKRQVQGGGIPRFRSGHFHPSPGTIPRQHPPPATGSDTDSPCR
ncbi:hypothetical protein [Proteiniphilum sp. X52]|uniref:IS66 family insertion sequence element accessory protein TnpA n=1 Tax=Proteiniphilum sp. X52 TaxID=2382159 RepID=UPI000F0A801C|nr:hypothetical protein [Proteiniphilum sp. X52]RNC64443.1 hypothetical protein D7D25_11080 [Proteiniphilum sp. X52]